MFSHAQQAVILKGFESLPAELKVFKLEAEEATLNEETAGRNYIDLKRRFLEGDEAVNEEDVYAAVICLFDCMQLRLKLDGGWVRGLTAYNERFLA